MFHYDPFVPSTTPITSGRPRATKQPGGSPITMYIVLVPNTDEKSCIMCTGPGEKPHHNLGISRAEELCGRFYEHALATHSAVSFKSSVAHHARNKRVEGHLSIVCVFVDQSLCFWPVSMCVSYA